MPLEFTDPGAIAPAGAQTTAALVSAAADLALVIDGAGIITDLSHNLDLRPDASLRAWRGQPVASVIKAESRPTLEKHLDRARTGRRTERFDVDHLLQGGRELPIRYAAVGIEDAGRIVLLGRDLRPVADLQSRVLDNLQSIESTARTQKQIEARYRLLFETSSDSIVFVDAATGTVRDINPRAASLLGLSPAQAAGRKFSAVFDKAVRSDVKSLLAAVSVSGTPGRLGVALPGGEVDLEAGLFRAGEVNLIMVRIVARQETGEAPDSVSAPGIDALARNASEAIVLTDADGAVIWANESFLVMAGLPLAAHAAGKSVDAFLQWSNVERQALFDAVDKHGRGPIVAGTVVGTRGQATDVEMSVVAMNDGAMRGYGFVMRERGAEEPSEPRGNSDLLRTAEGLAEMIGRVPMKDLVRDTTDVIERMCIEAALKLTGNNRASTARVLGLSRQALYLKMHRFGIADAD
jgi:transcriptional regulator PpsR